MSQIGNFSKMFSLPLRLRYGIDKIFTNSPSGHWVGASVALAFVPRFCTAQGLSLHAGASVLEGEIAYA